MHLYMYIYVCTCICTHTELFLVIHTHMHICIHKKTETLIVQNRMPLLIKVTDNPEIYVHQRNPNSHRHLITFTYTALPKIFLICRNFIIEIPSQNIFNAAFPSVPCTLTIPY